MQDGEGGLGGGKLGVVGVASLRASSAKASHLGCTDDMGCEGCSEKGTLGDWKG